MDNTQLLLLRTAVSEITNLNAGVASRSPEKAAKFRDVVTGIRHALLRDFEANVTRYERLRDAFVSSGVPVPVLSACGRGTREIRYSQLLRFFLDPSQSHGLGDAVLMAFIRPELEGAGLDALDLPWCNAVTEAEVPLGAISTSKGKKRSTLDLLLRVGELTVLVEHKIGSPESGSVTSGELTQLERYSKAFEDNFPSLAAGHLLKIFLTPEGRTARVDSEWTAVSHGDLVNRFASVFEVSGLSRMAKHNLATLLWDLMSGPLSFNGRLKSQFVKRLSQAIEDSDNSIPLRAWCNRNALYLDVMLRTVESCDE